MAPLESLLPRESLVQTCARRISAGLKESGAEPRQLTKRVLDGWCFDVLDDEA